MKILHVLRILALAAILISATVARAADAKPKVVLAGDSTVTDSAGWGGGFAKAFNDNMDVINLSKGGRSSKSFRDEGHWQKVLNEKPAVVLIQFGHNDQPGKGPERETDPKTTYRENLARYIDESIAIGAKPVIVTSLARRKWTADGLHIVSDLTDYADAAKAVAREKNVPCIDLHARSIDWYESAGKKGTDLISPLNKEGQVDTTHLNIVGSESFGPLVADELRRAMPELSRNIRGYILPDKRLATTRPTTVPSSPELAAQFRVRGGTTTAQGEKSITVAADGSGDFTTIQAALNAVPDDNSDRTIIVIKPGIYVGPIVVLGKKQNVTFKGDGAEKSIITYALNVSDPIPEGVPEKMGGNGVIVFGNGFEATDITFRNTSGDHGQAMALRLQADRAVLKNCRLLGWQDTLLTHTGRHYFRDCYIEGRVDFIYGGATAVFDRCEIVTKNGGYITAASTPQDQNYGYLFYKCKVSGTGQQAFLGRPWRPYGQVSFIECDLGDNIAPAGWHNWGKADNEKTARYFEFKNTGPGADRSNRVNWAKELTEAEAVDYGLANYLKGSDGWDPTR